MEIDPKRTEEAIERLVNDLEGAGLGSEAAAFVLDFGIWVELEQLRDYLLKTIPAAVPIFDMEVDFLLNQRVPIAEIADHLLAIADEVLGFK